MYQSILPVLLLCSTTPNQATPASGPSYDDVVAVYRQTASSLPALRVKLVLTGGDLKEYRAFQKKRLADLKKKFAALSPAEKKASQAEIEEAIKVYEERSREPELPPYREEITLERSPRGIEIKRMLVDDLKDKREQEAQERGISPATGGRFTLYRLDRTAAPERWMALDPYPFKGTTQPVYTSFLSKLPFSIPLLPPLFSREATYELLYPDLELVCLTAPREGSARAAFPLSAANAPYLLSLVEQKKSLLAASVSLQRGGIPDWMGRFQYLSENAAPLEGEKAVGLNEMMGRLRRQWSVPSTGNCYPTQAVWLEGWQKLDGDLDYPRTLVLRLFSLVLARHVGSAGEQPRAADGQEAKLVVGVGEYRLEVTSIERIQEPDRSYTLEVPNGARLIDHETGKSTIVGEAEDNVDQMLGSQHNGKAERDRQRLMLVVVNGVVLAALGGWFWYRRRSRRAAPPEASR